MAAEQKYKDPDSVQQRLLAKCMLVIMVRGLFNSLKFQYEQFPASCTKGSQLFPILWQCIICLMCLGLTVISVTCDEASDNWCIFSLHGTGKDFVYKTVNVFANKSLQYFFASDLSHIIKTIKNCISQGKLWESV